MRQIFSVILAAALVFGGALLSAHFFGSVEITREDLADQSDEPGLEKRRPDTDTQTDQSDRNDPAEPAPVFNARNAIVRTCPDVDSLLKGPWPTVFERDHRFDYVLDEGFSLYRVVVHGAYDVTENSAKARTLECNYHKPVQGKSYYEGANIRLASDLDLEIDLGPNRGVSQSEELWQSFSTDHASLEMAEGYMCQGTAQECSFVVFVPGD